MKYREDLRAHIHKGYEVENVPGRTSVFIHSANAVEELLGCIAVGVKALYLVYNSRENLSKLYALAGDTDTLAVQRLGIKASE